MSLRLVANILGMPEMAEKYMLLRRDISDPFFLVVSAATSKMTEITRGHNTILSVTSYSDQRSQEVARYFEDSTGVALKQAPERLARVVGSMGGFYHMMSAALGSDRDIFGRRVA